MKRLHGNEIGGQRRRAVSSATVHPTEMGDAREVRFGSPLVSVRTNLADPIAPDCRSAEELLARMLSKVDDLCTERDRQVREQRVKYPGTDKAIIGPIERRI
jgi:hypothetical protein